MTPGSFDHATCRAVIGDDESRLIEAKARADADAGSYNPPDQDGETYWHLVQSAMRIVIYNEQHTKRKARNERKAMT